MGIGRVFRPIHPSRIFDSSGISSDPRLSYQVYLGQNFSDVSNRELPEEPLVSMFRAKTEGLIC